MNIRSETIERLAALAKLELSPVELEQLSGELETVVNYMGVLSQLPVESTQCPAPTPSLHNVLREDKAIASPSRALLLGNAPETDGSNLTVPKTVGGAV